jgi:TonB family protein
MADAIRGNSGELRSSMSFSVSGLVHGLILAWVALGHATEPRAPAKSIYDQEIRPNEKRIIWYHLRDRLPDVTPAVQKADPRPPRASRKFDQSIVSGPKDDQRPPQLIWMPVPEVQAPKLLPLPNAVAVAPSARAVRPFAAPPEKRLASPAPSLPDAPAVAAPLGDRKPALAVPAAAPVRKFAAPQDRAQPQAVPALPEAPKITASMQDQKLSLAASQAAPVRGFARPAAQIRNQPAPSLTEAPQIASAVAGGAAAPVNAGLRAPVRTFASPPGNKPQPTDPPANLADAPTAGGPLTSGNAEATLAIASLNPIRTPEPPTPQGAREANFSAGPKPTPNGGNGSSADGSSLVVPGLLARGGAKDDQPTLVANTVPVPRPGVLAAIRAMPPGSTMPEPGAHSPRVAAAPDPILAGRIIYTVAIQMPNVTSYSGSWTVWFAERGTGGHVPAEMRPPVPLRKVDPKYIASAAADRVEGKVMLSAVIRRDGHVDSVALLRHLDDRLDRSAQEALGKWLFEPAQRNGDAVDVDAVFEIPFRLMPTPAK